MRSLCWDERIAVFDFMIVFYFMMLMPIWWPEASA